jgi:hypothetical protein
MARRLGVRRRLARGCTSYLLFLMVVTTQHARAEAARFSRRHTSPCSTRLQAHRQVAVSTLERLSTQPAKHVAQARHQVQERPWPMAMVVDSTLQQRASRPPAHAKTFKHGQGGGVGHQWTQSVVLLHDRLIPRRPIPCSSQRYGREHALAYRTEHDLVVEDIQTLHLADALGA